MNRTARTITAALLVAVVAEQPNRSEGQVLVGDPFITGYNNWVDTFSGSPGAGALPGWRLHFGNDTLMEPSDGRAVDGATNAGDYSPYVLIQDGVSTPTAYSVNARMMTSDDDGFGVAFGWQDNDNYFRVGMRQQTSGSLGFTRGLAVQKVVGGVATQISPAGVGEGDLSVPTQAMIDNRTPIDLTVDVDGANWSISVAGQNNDQPLVSGSDADLMPGKAGVLSWAQRSDSGTTPAWGTEVDSFAILDASGASLFSDSFPTAAVSPVAWRAAFLTNSDGVRIDQTGTGDDLGNFGLDFRNQQIVDDSNGFEWATATAPNVDFIGPSLVVDEPGSEAFADYQVRVRMANGDNDGIGALVRVQGDDTLYRVNFANQDIGSNEQRAPRGLSVQKVLNGVWSELFRDDQGNPLFLYNPGTPFDVSINAIGDQLSIQVINDPDGAAQVINYPTITDASDPILTGTVGFTNWGSGATSGGGATWGPYGGVAGPLVVVIPEPAAMALLCTAAMGLGGLRSRRTGSLIAS